MGVILSKIFILGSSGYIGKALIAKLNLLQTPYVTVGRKDADIVMDLSLDYQPLINEVYEGDFIVFLAAISSPEICKNDREMAKGINVTATGDIIDALSEKGARIIFSSSDVVFGKSESVVFDESTLAPFGDYGEMKAEIENKFQLDSNVKVIRFSYVMGPGDKYTDMLVKFASENQTLDVFGGFERNVVALSDVTSGIISLINKWDVTSENAINFSGPECISRWDMTRLFAERFCPNLTSKLVEAPIGFWNSRPKKIESKNVAFTKLLGKQAKSVQENLNDWEEI